MKNAKQLPKNLLSPVDDFTDDEDDFGTNYKISPIDDEEWTAHSFANYPKILTFIKIIKNINLH